MHAFFSGVNVKYLTGNRCLFSLFPASLFTAMYSYLGANFSQIPNFNSVWTYIECGGVKKANFQK